MTLDLLAAFDDGVGTAGDLGLLFLSEFHPGWVVTITEGPGGVVAVFLKGVNLTAESAEDDDGAGESLGGGGELPQGIGPGGCRRGRWAYAGIVRLTPDVRALLPPSLPECKIRFQGQIVLPPK